MSKLFAIVLIIILLLAAGCGAVSKIEQKTEEPTRAIIQKSTAVPTKQSFVVNTESPTLEPTTSAGPTIEPLPTQVRTATPVQEVKPDSPSYDLSILFEKMAQGTKTEKGPVLEIPDRYLGNDMPGCFSTHDYAVRDENGNVYYTDFNHIYRIDAATGETTKILANEDINEKYDFTVYDPNAFPNTIYYKDGKLYAYITVEYDELRYMNFMVDVFSEKILYDTTEDIKFVYDSRVIRSYYDSELKDFIYKQYTLRGNSDRNMFNNPEGYDYYILKYVSDKYVFFLNKKYAREDDDSQLLIIDKDTMEIAEVIKACELDFNDLEILLCKDEWMMLFDKNAGAVKFYNIDKGELTTYWRFRGNNTFLGYDSEECCVYVRKSEGYTHRELRDDQPHYFFSDCISEEELPDATEIFVKYNLLTLEEEVLNIVKSADYMSKFLCFDSINEYIVGGYLFVYPDAMEESYTQYHYEQKFKLGEEIDFDTWRD